MLWWFGATQTTHDSFYEDKGASKWQNSEKKNEYSVLIKTETRRTLPSLLFHHHRIFTISLKSALCYKAMFKNVKEDMFPCYFILPGECFLWVL